MMRVLYDECRQSWRPAMMRKALLLVLLFNAGQTVHAAGNLKLPSGPEGPGRFGAYYENLSFSPEWDAAWRIGPKADVVVRFDTDSQRLVFWHGSNYIPCWVNDKGVWYSNGAVVREGAGPHQDRICRYCFVSVVENSDARVVVRWRYAPVDKEGKLINTDPMTNWNDWVDEYYTIYPDSTGVRHITLHSTNWDQQFRCQQSIIISQPAQTSVEARVTDFETAAGKKNITIVDVPGGKPFYAVSTRGNITRSLIPDSWTDWPAFGAAQKPINRFLSSIMWEPCEEDRTSKSWIMLVGLSNGKEDEVKSLAQSWLSAPKLDVSGKDFSISGYDAREKAYQITCEKPGEPSSLKLTIQGSAASPVVNPAFVIKGWGKTEALVKINGTPAKSGTDFRYGFRKTTTVSDLIVWLPFKFEKPVSIEVRPVGGRKE